MNKIGIIGWGIVGQATGKGLAKSKKNKVVWYDPYKRGGSSLSELIGESEFIFVCVPTPMYNDYSGIDCTIVDQVVKQVAPNLAGTEKILTIKSTVLPGTTSGYIKKYPRTHFAMNPEFLTERRANWDFLHPDRTIIGTTERYVARRLTELYFTIYSKTSPIFVTDPTSAELAKYMSNVMLASKVMLANEFYALARKLRVDYDKVRQMVEIDKRIGTHLRVPGPDGDLGFGGKCFPKDIVALLELGRKLKVDLTIIKTIWRKNLKIRKKHDWEQINGVVTRLKKERRKGK